MVVEETNNSTSVLPNHKINVIWNHTSTADTGFIVATVMEQAQVHNVVAIIGDSPSANQLYAATAARIFSKPIFTWGATQSVFDNKKLYPTFVRSQGSNSAIALWVLNSVKGFGYKNIAFIFTAGATDSDTASLIIAYAPQMGVKIVVSALFASGSPDASLQALAVKKSKTRIHVVGALNADMTTWIKAAIQEKIVGPGYLSFSTSAVSTGFWTSANGEIMTDVLQALQGMYFAGAPVPANIPTPKYDAFVEQYKNWPFNPAFSIAYKTAPVGFAQSAYESALMMVEALHYVIEVLKLDPLKNPMKIVEATTMLNGTGLTGTSLRADKVTYSRSSGYRYGPLSGTSVKQSTCLYESFNKTWTLLSPPVFVGDVVPVEFDPRIMVSIGSAGLSGAVAVGCFGCILVLFCAVILIRFESKVVFKAAAPTFLKAILLGSLMGYIALMFLGMDNGNSSLGSASCQIYQWLLTNACTLVFASLLVKTYRIHRIFNESSLQVVRMTDAQLLVAVTVIQAVEVMINLVWSIHSPLRLTMVDIDDIRYFEQCSSDNFLAFLIVSLVYKGIILLTGCWLSWQVRNAPAAFSESKQIFFSIYNLFFIASICLPLSLGLSDPLICHAVRVAGVMFAISGTVGTIFFNGVYMACFDQNAMNANTDISSVKTNVGNTVSTVSESQIQTSQVEN